MAHLLYIQFQVVLLMSKGGVAIAMEKWCASLALSCMHLVVWLQILSSCNGDSNMGCHESERTALVEFRSGLSDPLGRLSSWDGHDCCRWRGITCQNVTGYVIILDLHNPYSIYEPSDQVSVHGYWNLSGRLDPSLLKLKHLRHLDLSGNTFAGIPIPDFIGSLMKLRYLNLSAAGFGGVIPRKIGNLAELRFLDLSCDVICMLSVDSLWWASNLSSLQVFEMKGLDLSTVGRDWVHVMNTIPSLIKLRLPLCGLTDIPTSLFHINFTSLRVLDLQNNFFGSEFPPWIANLSNLVSLELNGCDLHGPIPMAIAELRHLQVINLGTNYNLTADLSVLLEGSWMAIKIMDLSENRFYGEIPISIGNLTSLVELNLGYNSIKGRIPKTIGNLCGLRKLNLYANMIEQIPDSIETAGCISQTPFPNLAFLLLGGNPIHGSMPVWFGQLKRLEWLDLQDCSMTGPILESLGRLPFLNTISFYKNRLNGTLPTTFGQLSKLTYLDVSMNSLTGIVSESHFEKLSELKILMLSSNSLIFNVSPTWVPPFRLEFIDLGSCHLGPRFPSWLSKQNLTQHLDLSNAAISDTIPNWFWDIASHLSHLNLSNNYIHGRLPSQISFSGWATVDLSSNRIQGPFPLPMKVSQLDLSNNSLVGPIPENINHVMQSASLFLVSGNQINGTIPSAFGEMMYLKVLDLSRNNLHGSIPPTLGGCTEMEALDLCGNHLSGPIPESIGLLTHLRTLHLNENNLSQELPSSMKNCSSLETLDLGENIFSGSIPTWIGKSFPSLRILRLRSNTFTGEIPPQISNLSSLQVLDLANNHLTGLIPSSIGNLTAMQTPQKQKQNHLLAYGIYYNERIYIISYVERLLVSMQDKMFEYNKTLSLMTSMDLSSNCLIGEIPDSLMNLSGMLILNLSNNRLGGHIPDRIGNLQELMTFDVSRNQLSGLIPSSMVSMSFLNDVNFSSNNFSGRIPSGNQFSTFKASVYNGNPDLCGPPILRECEGWMPPGRSEVTDGGDGSEIPWFYVSVGLGFGVGFLGVHVVLFLRKSWEDALFGYVQKMVMKLIAIWIVIRVKVRGSSV